MIDTPDVAPGIWHYGADQQVSVVQCECGQPIYYREAIHTRLVIPKLSAALCRRCRRLVRVPLAPLPDGAILLTGRR